MWYVDIKNAINLSTSLCLPLLSLLLLLFLQTLLPHVRPPSPLSPSLSLSLCLSVCLPARLVAVITYVCRQFMLSSAVSQSQLATCSNVVNKFKSAKWAWPQQRQRQQQRQRPQAICRVEVTRSLMMTFKFTVTLVNSIKMLCTAWQRKKTECACVCGGTLGVCVTTLLFGLESEELVQLKSIHSAQSALKCRQRQAQAAA